MDNYYEDIHIVNYSTTTSDKVVFHQDFLVVFHFRIIRTHMGLNHQPHNSVFPVSERLN